MANRYWVGGTAAWDNTAGTKWSTTSGGAGGAAVPTSSDDVFFNAASGAVSVNTGAVGNALSLNFTGFTGTFSGAQDVNVYGSLTLGSGMNLTYAGSFVFRATSTGWNITTNGKTNPGLVVFNGVGGGWTFQDNYTSTNAASCFNLTAGTVDTNGKTITLTIGSFLSTGSGTRVLTLGASSLLIGGSFTMNGTNFTVNQGTSSIEVNTNNSSGSFSGENTTTYYTVIINCRSVAQASITGIGSVTNLTIKTTATVFTCNLDVPLTVTGTFTATGSSTDAAKRLLIQPTATTTVSVTITAANVSLSDVNFFKVIGAGAASWTGTRLGNAGANSGITFATPVNRYWVGNAGNWNDSTHWSATSGGGGGASIPLPQDSAFFNASSFSSGSQTVTVNQGIQLSAMDWTGVTNTPTFTITTSSDSAYCGNVTFNTGMVLTLTVSVAVWGDGNLTITTGGLSYSAVGLLVRSPTVTLLFGSNFVSAGSLTHTFGTIDTGVYNLTFTTVNIASGATFNLNSSTLTLINAGASFTVNASSGWSANSNSTIKMTNTANTAATFAGGGKTFGIVSFERVGSTGNRAVSGSNTFDTLSDVGTAAHSVVFTQGTTQTITNWNISGASGAVVTINSSNTNAHSLIKVGGGPVSADYLNIQHSVATPANAWYAGANSVDNQAVATAGSGWIFAVAPQTKGNFLMFM